MYIMRWEVVWENLPNLLAGLVLGLEVAVGSIFIGAMIGLVAAFARTSSNRVLQRSVAAYVEFVRNLPLLLIIHLLGQPFRECLVLHEVRRTKPVCLDQRRSDKLSHSIAA